MSVQICISHNGQVLVFDDPTARLEALRSWIEANAGIPSTRQILMTARGKNVKNLANEAEIFVYDKQFLSAESTAPSKRNDSLDKLRDPPSAAGTEENIQAWQELFMSQRTWALQAVETIKTGIRVVDSHLDEDEIIARSIKAVLDNLKNHVTTLKSKFDTTHQWARDRLQEQKDTVGDWQASANTLNEIPIREDVANILRRPQRDIGSTRNAPLETLFDLIETKRLEVAAESLKTASAALEKSTDGLQESMNDLVQDSSNAQKLEVEPQSVDTANLLEEAETLAKRINSDYEELIKLPDSPKSISVASRKATTHSRDFQPALQSIMDDVITALYTAQENRNNAAQKCFLTLQEISKLQSRIAELQKRISGLEFQEDESFQILSKVFQLPLVYGSTLVEAVRRSEWTENMRVEVDTVHEDISQHTEEEQRRRRKWVGSFSMFLNEDLNTNDTLIDLKASKPRNTWPFVSRDEIFAYVDEMRALGIDEAVAAITRRLKDLDLPVRKQRLKAFKNGSVHDLSQSGTIGNADEMRSLRDDKLRLEDKLRSSDSRVRKLEDLLHRQSQLSRATSGTFVPGSAPDFERQVSSPNLLSRPSDLSRRSSVSVRRLSNTQDEKALVQRIVSLEAQIQKLQDEAHAERRSSTESRDKMQEAESVKRDLMANFEAQRQEFDDERQLLDDDNHKLKIRLEEMEDELDRIIGSREHQKLTQDKKIKNLNTELEQLRKDTSDDVAQVQRRGDVLQKDISLQRERAATLERQVHQYREERTAAQNHNMALANQLRSHEEQQQDFITLLQSTHANLSPAGSPPEEMRRLVNALEILSEGAAIHARKLDDSLQLSTAENKALEEKFTYAEAQIKNLKANLASTEGKVASLTDDLDQERNKTTAVRSELSEEQAELRNLRAKFAAGETGSDALRERLDAEKQKVAELLERKMESEGFVRSLRHELEVVTKDMTGLSKEREGLRGRLDTRGEKIRQLSERLFQYNDRVIRMLEQFGYSVSRQDENLLIQRASRAKESTILSGGEGSSSMRRTISGSVPIQHYSDPSDLETLYWMSDSDVSSEENKYQNFLTALQRLDVDANIDLVTKRYKDVENLAKKYQKDSRLYREKAHRLQSEAHDKIAYRSFKEGDLALFLPTRNQATKPWAAFNVGAPHYFLREQETHKLQARDWLLARINRVEERVVDLSRSLSTGIRGTASINTEASDGASARSIDDENPFELSDGLRWYMIDASEEKPGAPGTPSVGKSTVTASNVDVKGHMGRKEKSSIIGSGNAVQVTKNLTKSLDSRRSSSGSKKTASLRGRGEGSSLKDVPAPLAPISSDTDGPAESSSSVVRPSEGDAKPGQAAREDAKVFEVDGYRSPTKSNIGPQKGVTGTPVGHTVAERSQGPSRISSPLKQRTTSPTKPAPSPVKGKAWDKLFSMEYNG